MTGQREFRREQFSGSLIAGAVFLGSLFVAIPLTIYVGNDQEFASSFPRILQLYAPYLACLGTGLGLLGALMPGVAYRRYVSVVSALTLLVWFQGNILVWNYGPMDGRHIAWLDDAWRGVLDIAIWTTVLIWAYRNVQYRQALAYGAVVTLVIQIVISAFAIRPDNGLASRESEDNIAGRDSIVGFSPDRNVLHVVMDGFQSDVFAEIINDPKNENLRDQLEGFTFFEDNMSVFPYTQMAVPALLTGKVYENQVPAQEFVDAALRGRTILNAARDSGYEVDIAAPIALKRVYGLGGFTHAYGIAAGNHATKSDYARIDGAKLIDLSLFRAVPHFFKALVYRDALWVFQSPRHSAAYLQMQYFSDLAFLRRLHDEMAIDRKKPVYKMLHLMLSHRPTVGSSSCEFDGIMKTTRQNVLIQARCGLLKVVAVLQRMKELGIYDNSLILLMADHGAWVPATGVYNLSSNGGDEKAEVDPQTIGMAVPVLAIKPPGSSGALRISDAPTSITDIPATVSTLLNLDATFDGLPAFDAGKARDRRRRHLVYAYGKNPDHDGYFFTIREYQVDGSPFDAAAWHATRLLRPENNVEVLAGPHVPVVRR